MTIQFLEAQLSDAEREALRLTDEIRDERRKIGHEATLYLCGHITGQNRHYADLIQKSNFKHQEIRSLRRQFEIALAELQREAKG